MEQGAGEDWAAEVSAVVAQEVKRHRERLGMSAQRLSNACKENGYPIPRTVITKLENGHRKFVTVAEVLALSGALRVSPVMLLVPLGRTASVPVLPGQRRGPADALAWFRGDRPLGRGEPAAIYVALRAYVKADDAARELYELLDQWDPKHAPDNDPSVRGAASVQDRPPGWGERFEATLERVRDYRSQLRAMNHPLPPLPLGLEWVDLESAAGGDG